MRATIVMEGRFETGRGPLFRRLGMLADLAASCRLSVICLGEPDPEVRRRLVDCAVPFSVRPARLDGWSMTNLDTLVPAIIADVTAAGTELVVLDWELWDLMRELSAALATRNIRFATVVHAVPFLNTPAEPTGDFLADVRQRLAVEPDPAVARYLRRHAGETVDVLHRLDVLAPNRCVVDYLRGYFPDLPVHLLEPGYAVDLNEIAHAAPAGPETTFAFMARLVAEKGIYPLLEAFAKITCTDGFADSRLLIIGSFEDHAEQARFTATADQLGVLDRLEFAGWRHGSAKYAHLRRARVFLYPPAESDTFSICMLEALACGLSVVCADVPFSRSIYRTEAVVRCPAGDSAAFARAAVRLAADPAAAAAAKFAARYGSWRSVAVSEVRAYRKLLGG